MGGIDLNGPPAQPQRQIDRLSLARSCRVAQRPAGEKHEDLGRIGERQLGVRKAAVKNAGDMIDKDRGKREAAPEVHGVGLTKHRIPCGSSVNFYAMWPATGG